MGIVDKSTPNNGINEHTNTNTCAYVCERKRAQETMRRIYTHTLACVRVCVRGRVGSRLLIGVCVYLWWWRRRARETVACVSVCACGRACMWVCVHASSRAHKHKVHHHNNTHRKEGGSRHAEKPEATRCQKCVPQCYHQLCVCVCVCVCVMQKCVQ